MSTHSTREFMARFFLPKPLNAMRSFLIIFICLLCLGASSQSVTGYWYGSAAVSGEAMTNNYLIEMVLRQEGSSVKGLLNYYFKDQFRSQSVKGNYNAGTRVITINNVALPWFRSTSTFEVDCKMDFSGILRVSQVASVINGSFVGTPEYKNTCPEIMSSLRQNNENNNLDSIIVAIREFKETKQLWKPSVEDTVVAVTVQARKVTNYVIDQQFGTRETVVAEEIEVEGDSLQVDFYDNGEVDGDSIAIFLNKKLIAYHQRLSTKSIHFTFPLDTLKTMNEISMFAENLGSIPPNTALMVLDDGVKRFELRLSSSLDKNATIRIKRKKKGIKVK
jgi:hypothetical protein